MTSALAAAAARRLVRHPVVLFGVIGAIFDIGAVLRRDVLVLARDDTRLAGSLVMVAAGFFLATHLDVSAPQRHGVERLLHSLPAGGAPRVVSNLIGAVVAALCLGILATGALVGAAKAGGALAAPNPSELAGGVVAVAVAAAAGVLVGAVTPSVLTSSVVLLAAAGGQVWLASAAEFDKGYRWFALHVPVRILWETEILPRPAALHLLYLVLLLALLVLLLVARLSRSGGAWTGAAVLALATVVVGASTGVKATDRSDAMERAAAGVRRRQCHPVDGITYCRFTPKYDPWVDRWDAAVRPVWAQLPAAKQAPPLVVFQVATPSPVGVPGQAHPGIEWGRGRKEAHLRLQLAADVATWAVGLPSRYRSSRGDGVILACSAVGRARAVVAAWLATHGSPDALDDVVEGFPDDATVAALWDESLVAGGAVAITWSVADIKAALSLARLGPTVGDSVRRHWSELVDPSTPSNRVGAILGVPLPQPQDAALFTRNLAPCP